MAEGAPDVEADAAADTRAGDGTCGDEHAPRDETPTGVDAHLADALAAADRERQRGGCDHALDERPVDTHRLYGPARRDERHVPFPVPDRVVDVDASGLDHPYRVVTGDPPPQQRGQVAVALRTTRAAEQCRVERHAVPTHRRDFAPAGRRRVASLHAVEAAKDAQE